MMRQCIFFLCLVGAVQANAEVVLDKGNIVIQNVVKPEIDIICSKKQAKVILSRINFDNPGAQAGWSTELTPFMCTVFFAEKESFTFSCSQASSGAWQHVDCAQYVLASTFPWNGAMLANASMEGSYWVAENIASDDVPMVLRHRDFDV